MDRLILITRALALTLALLAVAPAHARAGESLGFGVQALDSPRGYFEFRGRPGATVRGTLALTNPGRKAVTVELRPQDVGTAATGGLQYEPARPGGTGRWARLGATRVPLAPGEARRVAITARIPQDARPGDHLGGVAVYDVADLRRVNRESRDRRSVALRFISRFAVALQYRVPGPAAAGVAVGDTRVETTPSGTAVLVDLRNTGDLLIPRSRGRITVEHDDQVVAEHAVDLTSFVPGTAISIRVPLKGAPVQGSYRVHGFIHPARAPALRIDEKLSIDSEHGRQYERNTGRAAPGSGGAPAWVWTLGALLMLAAAFAMGRRRGGAATPPAPAAPPEPPFVATVIDLNTASAEELESLPGIGPSAAARIVAHRGEFGAFESLAELEQVDGFGPKRIARLRERAAGGAAGGVSITVANGTCQQLESR